MEIVRTPIRGMYRDILKGPDGRNIFDSGWVSNTIVNGCHILLAEFMKGTTSESEGGIQYMAVGAGDATWDTHGAVPGPELENLVLAYPQQITWLKFTYLDNNDIEVDGPTNRLQIEASMPAKFPNPDEQDACDLREFGLFAKLNGKTRMINVIRHPLIRKEPQMSLERVVRLYF